MSEHFRHQHKGPSLNEMRMWGQSDISNKDSATLQNAVKNIHSFRQMITDPWSGYKTEQKGEGARNRQLLEKLEQQEGNIRSECAGRGLILDAAGRAKTNYWGDNRPKSGDIAF